MGVNGVEWEEVCGRGRRLRRAGEDIGPGRPDLVLFFRPGRAALALFFDHRSGRRRHEAVANSTSIAANAAALVLHAAACSRGAAAAAAATKGAARWQRSRLVSERRWPVGRLSLRCRLGAWVAERRLGVLNSAHVVLQVVHLVQRCRACSVQHAERAERTERAQYRVVGGPAP